MNRILIIEDDLPTRRQIAQLLQFEGFEVFEAAEGRAGVDLARACSPDVILCDIMMPVLDGFGVLQELRGCPATALVPFIFLTAKVEVKDLRHAMDEGADDYLTKPFRPDDLLASVRQRLTRRARQMEEARRCAEEVSLAVASALPDEMLASFDHIDALANLLVLQGDTASPQLKAMRAGLHREANRLRRLVRRLNLFARLPHLYARRFELAAAGTVQETEAVVRTEALATAQEWSREGDVALTLAARPLPISGEYLGLITRELVSNACKFSAAGTRIDVRGESQQECWKLTVSDLGSGMSGDEIRRIRAFQQFWTGGTRPTGLGLGLVLAQGLARLHGGELTIESECGKGTQVCLLVPGE